MAAKTLAPLVAAQLNHLLSRSPFHFKVDQIGSGCKSGAYADRFTLLVPYCLDYIKWDVIYNAQYPSAAPDFVFSAEDEGFHPLPLVDGDGREEDAARVRKSSLFEWNCKDRSRLLTLVHELREMYTSYQRKRVAEIDDERLKFEINTVLSREGIEVCLVSGNERADEVKFSVPLLDIDLNKLVPGCPWKQEQRIYLQAVFSVTQKYSTPAPAPRLKLYSTTDLRMLFSIEDVKLPTWFEGMCMAEYIPTLEDNIKAQIVEAVASIGARRRFIEALVPLLGRPVESDPVFCRRTTVLAISGGFTFLVHFSLSTQFPKQQPVLVLQSSTHFNSQGAPILSPPLKDYPWSPRWDPSQMADRIFDFLADECLNFKKYCNDAIPQLT